MVCLPKMTSTVFEPVHPVMRGEGPSDSTAAPCRAKLMASYILRRRGRTTADGRAETRVHNFIIDYRPSVYVPLFYSLMPKSGRKAGRNSSMYRLVQKKRDCFAKQQPGVAGCGWLQPGRNCLST